MQDFFLLIVSKREVQFSKVGSVESNILHFLWWIKILKKYFLKKDFKVTMILANWQSTKIFTNTMFLLRTGVFFLFRFYLGYLHHLIFFLSRNFLAISVITISKGNKGPCFPGCKWLRYLKAFQKLQVEQNWKIQSDLVLGRYYLTVA